MNATKPTRTALVIGHDARSFLAVIRSLGRAGVGVHIAGHNPDSVAQYSRYVARAHALPPATDEAPFVDGLAELMQRERFDLVLPCEDHSIGACQRNRQRLARVGRVYLLDDRAYDVLFDKFRTTELARSVGVPTPRERVVTTTDEAKAALDDFGYPLVLKPRSSFTRENESKQLVRKAYSRAEFDQQIGRLISAGAVAIQENCPGHGVGVELLMAEGEPLLTFQHERVHEPLLGGGSSYRRSVPVRADLLDASLRILRSLHYTGLAMVEFKVDARNGRWVFLEVNARVWGSLPLAVAAGANFPLALFELLVDGRKAISARYRSNIYCRNVLMDMAWQRANLRADHRDPTLATRPIGLVLRDALLNPLLLRERLDTLTWDDPGPAIRELGQVLRRGLAAVGAACRRRYLVLGPVRRGARRRAIAALQSARQILFVCKGNICRSPFAERLLRRAVTGNVAVSSAGYFRRAGRASPAESVAAAREWGVELDDHRSVRLTGDQIEAADAIFVFDLANLQRVRGEFPSAQRKLHLVGALARTGPLFISDPWGQPAEVHQQVYRQIAAALAAAREAC